MSWVNDHKNVVRDYIHIDELFTRPVQFSPMPKADAYEGRNRTALEQALDSAFFNAAVNLGIRKFKDPLTCPPEHLHKLAIEKGVFDWYQEADIGVQREMVATSKEIHRKAGTIQGLTQAIKQMGVEFTISNTSEPYELKLITTSNLTATMMQQMNDRITRYKSERDNVNFERIVPTRTDEYYAVATYSQVSYYTTSEG